MRKLILTAALAATAMGIGASSAMANELNGRWLMSDTVSVLKIRGNEWSHPAKGEASIRRGKGAADMEVYYHAHQGVNCSYRVYTANLGEILVLEPVDATQSSNFCPSGRLSRVSK